MLSCKKKVLIPLLNLINLASGLTIDSVKHNYKIRTRKLFLYDIIKGVLVAFSYIFIDYTIYIKFRIYKGIKRIE